MTNFRGVDMLRATPNTDAAPAKEPEIKTAEPEVRYEEVEAIEAPVDDAEPDEKVPSGSAAEVLQWVGDDKSRASRALAREKEDSTPRKGLSAELEEIINK